ncbi:MAG: hypothetical protein ABWY93_04690 [Mycobacterium sp.]
MKREATTPVSDDILQQIDDTVSGARLQQCACGCGTTLTDEHPSLYYAGPDCQARHQAAGATRAYEVQDRPDHSWYTEQTEQEPPRELFSLAAAVSEEARRLRDTEGSDRRAYREAFDLNWCCCDDGVPHRISNPACPACHPARSPSREEVLDRYGPVLTYQRRCPQCGQVSISGSALRPVQLFRQRRCVHCQHPFEQVVLAGWDYLRTGRCFELSVELEGRFTRVSLPLAALDAAADSLEMAGKYWLRLTDDLLHARDWAQSVAATSGADYWHPDLSRFGRPELQQIMQEMAIAARVDLRQGWNQITRIP